MTSWQCFLGRYLLQTGRISDAAATLDDMLATRPTGALVHVEDAAALVALGRIAIHTGDGHRGRAFARLAEDAFSNWSPELRRQAGWLLALGAMAEGDAAGARARLGGLGEEGTVSVMPLLLIDVVDQAHLVRIALGAGDRALAHLAVAATERVRDLNPGVSSIAAAAAHARGLLSEDLSALAEAAALLARGPRSLARAHRSTRTTVSRS